MFVAAALVVVLPACAPTKPDAAAKTIYENFHECMPGLKLTDITKASDARYSAITDRYAVAWKVEHNTDGTISTMPWPGDLPKFERQTTCFD